jgi:hypothetical protein
MVLEHIYIESILTCLTYKVIDPLIWSDTIVPLVSFNYRSTIKGLLNSWLDLEVLREPHISLLINNKFRPLTVIVRLY